ncbi:UNKNOWN [Stylonychia lemnae]|uniref:Uncharacterized protein n=1 Tax=Stylonychia lemnae TaxID=5949 RepID=A0A078A3X2_STYLE|nr:UNKNOWN [Stylonychia lemnae]|eukprot:CDW76569.1 UNKNOWN [Stylonychia lemnae]
MKTIITIAVALFIGAISTRQYQRAPTRSEIHNQRLYEAETEDLTVEDPLYYDGYYPQVEKNIFTKIGHGLRRVEPYIGPAFKIAGAIGGLSVEEPMFHDNVQYPQVEKNIFTKIGHGLRRVEPYIGPAFKIAGAIGGLSVQDQLSHEEEDYAYYPKVEKNVFTKIGHGLRRIEPYIGPAFKIAGAIGGLSVESPNPSPIYFYNDAFFPNVEKNIFTKIGHGLRRIEPYIGPAIKIAGAVGA